jgi:PAS domain S-box-containing protein
MNLKICDKFDKYCNKSSFLRYTLIVSIILQTYMIGRSIFLMYKIDSMLATLQSRLVELKNASQIFSGFENNISSIYEKSITKSVNKLNNFCKNIEKQINIINREKFDSEDYENIRLNILNFYIDISDRCKGKDLKLNESDFKKIANITAIISESKNNIYEKLNKYNGSYNLLSKLDFYLYSLVIISSVISVIIYLLIIFSFLMVRKINDDLKNKINEISKFKNGVDNAAVPIIITDYEGNIEYVNREFELIYGYSLSEVRGKNPRIISSGKTQLEVYQNLWKTIKSGKKWTGKFDNKSKNGDTIIVEAYINPVFDTAGKIINFVGIHRDITLQTKLMNDLIIARQQAEEASIAKSNFLSSMSHEIRTPLNAIVGMADLLKEMDLPQDAKNYIDILHNASDSLLAIINDILDISKIEAGKMEIENILFNLEKLLYDITEIIAIQASKKNIEVMCRIKPDVPLNLVGDPIKLRQIIMNLMGNSVKFVEKGWILLEVSKKDEDNENVYLNFIVEDTGIGIPKENLDKLFNRFVQADSSISRKYGGSGLGLSISKALVELMGGKISVTSEVGKGTKFSFDIKFKKTKTESEDFKKLSIESLKGIKILVVDDNDINRIIIKEMLAGLGAILYDTNNPNVGYNMLSKDRFDLAIIDYNMPEMNGYELSKKIMTSSEILNKPKIIITSSDIAKFKKENLKEINVDSFLLKPIKKSVLIDNLLSVLGKEKHEIIKNKEIQNYSKEDLPEIKILIVDDSEDNRILMDSYLKKSKVIYDMAENGIEALEKFKSNKYDIIFMDMQMPDMDGMEATKKIREYEKEKNLERTKIVALTANVLKEQIENALKNGFDDYLTKPIRKNNFYKYLIDYKK